MGVGSSDLAEGLGIGTCLVEGVGGVGSGAETGWVLATDRASDRAQAAQVKKWVRESLEYQRGQWPL